MRKGVIDGAVNVPLYSLIEGTTMYKQLRRAGFSYVFGVLNGQEVSHVSRIPVMLWFDGSDTIRTQPPACLVRHPGTT